MRGLLLTNYYLVYRTFFMFMGIAILGAGCVFYFGNASMYRLIATFIIFFAAIPALEVIKYESKSGYENMYLLYRLLEITLCKVTTFSIL